MLSNRCRDTYNVLLTKEIKIFVECNEDFHLKLL